MEHDWDFVTIFEHRHVLWVGVKGTVVIFVVTVALGLAGGLVVGIARYARDTLHRLAGASIRRGLSEHPRIGPDYLVLLCFSDPHRDRR